MRVISIAAVWCTGRAVVAAAFLLSVGIDSAVAASDPARCSGAGGGNTTHLATYSGPDGVSLQWGSEYAKECPGTAARCAKPGSKLRHGQALLIDGRYHDHVCASGSDKRGYEINGWLDAALVAGIHEPAPHPLLSAWVGTYGSPDETIKIRVVGGKLQVEGEAYWPAKNYKQGPGLPDRHEGGFSFEGLPAGNHIALGDHSDNLECWVDLDLFGPFLLSNSSEGCGGMNVKFWGALQLRSR